MYGGGRLVPALLLLPLGVSGDEAWHVLVLAAVIIAPNKTGTAARRGSILLFTCVEWILLALARIPATKCRAERPRWRSVDRWRNDEI